MTRGDAFFAAHDRLRLRAADRMWPDSALARSPWDAGAVYHGEMVLPERAPDEVEQEDPGQSAAAPRKAYVPLRPVANAWGRSPNRPARVVRSQKRSAAPSQDARAIEIVRELSAPAPAGLPRARRAAAPRRSRPLDRMARRIDETSLTPAFQGASEGAVSRNDTSPRPQRAAGAAEASPSRRAGLRAVAPPARAIDRLTRSAREQGLPDADVSALSVAAGRAAPSDRPQRGLRPTLAASPSVTHLSAAVVAEPAEV